jgi:hypothetical protein
LGKTRDNVARWTVEWRLRAGSADDLDVVEPLWVAVHHRHAQAMPERAPYVSDEQTWRVRRALYVELLVKPGTLLLVADVNNKPVGYGLAHVLPVEDTPAQSTRENTSTIAASTISSSGSSRAITTPYVCTNSTDINRPGYTYHAFRAEPGNVAVTDLPSPSLDISHVAIQQLSMIVRTWRATATPEGGRRYAHHFQKVVLPKLSALEGFRGAYVLLNDSRDVVEIEDLTLWESHESVRAFAGDDVVLSDEVVEVHDRPFAPTPPLPWPPPPNATPNPPQQI